MRKLIYIPLVFLSLFTNGQKVKFKSFSEFYTKISNKHPLVFSPVQMQNLTTVSKNIAPDTVQDYVSFKVDNWNIKYVTTRDTFPVYHEYFSPSYITINNQTLFPDSDMDFAGLEILEGGKTILNGTTYLVFYSYATGCNGSLCRASYDQLFQIKGDTINYQIILGWQNTPAIYCDLNNDGQLDLISFVGECFSKIKADEEKMHYCIQALTWQGKTWVPMKDNNGKPYYISIQTDDDMELEGLKVLDYNWMFSLL